MKAMIIMHLRDQMQKVIDEQGLPDVVFHVLFCFGYTNHSAKITLPDRENRI